MNKYQVVEYFGLISDKKEYKSDEKLTLVDRDGYKYQLSALNLNCLYRRKGNPNKFFGGNPFTEHNIKNYIKIELNNSIEIVDFMNAKSAKCEFIVRCKIHNIRYKRYWNIIKNGQICNLCGDEISRSKRRNNLEDIKTIALEKYNIEIISDEYINNLEPLQYICNKHKHIGLQYRSWANIISSSHPCAHCASESIVERNTKTHEWYIASLDNSVTKVDVIGTYVNSKENILVRCKTCGDEFYMRPDHIKNGVGCKSCITSKGEDKISEILSNNGVSFLKQHRFPDCRNIKPLPFDFYIEDNNICIEYDGEQHYMSVKMFGGDSELKKVKMRDAIKTKYCKDNNIKLMRIPYWEFDNIEEILLKELIIEKK